MTIALMAILGIANAQKNPTVLTEFNKASYDKQMNKLREKKSAGSTFGVLGLLTAATGGVFYLTAPDTSDYDSMISQMERDMANAGSNYTARSAIAARWQQRIADAGLSDLEAIKKRQKASKIAMGAGVGVSIIGWAIHATASNQIADLEHKLNMQIKFGGQ